MQIKKQEPHAMMRGKILPISCERRRVYSRLHKGHSLDLAVGERSSVGKFSTVFEQGPIRRMKVVRSQRMYPRYAADSDAILLLEVR